MSESNNDRWARHVAPFDVPAQPQKPAAPQESDRSWMPVPSVPPAGISGVNWHTQWEKAWQRPRAWAKQAEPEFSSQLEALETELSGLEKTLPSPYDSRLQPVKDRLSRMYTTLNRLHDGYVKKLPFVRY